MTSNPLQGRVRPILAVFLLLLSFVAAVGSAHSSQSLTDLSFRTEPDKITLFPGHRFKDINIIRVSPDLVHLDLPYIKYPGVPEILASPHPGVLFIRVSQINRNPDVVRATIVSDGKIELHPRLEAGALVVRFSTGVSTPGTVSEALRPPSALLDQKVNLNFANEDLMTILNALAVQFRLRIFADAGVRGRYSISARDIPLREVLKNLLLEKDFQYTLKGRDLTVISLQQDTGRVARELLFRDLGLHDALQTLSKMMNINIIIHESVTDRNVNFYVENLNLDELLELLISTNDLAMHPHNENTFIITSKAEGRNFGTRQYKTFKLVNAKPEEVIKTISGSKALAEKLDTSNMVVNERINALSVYDTLENLALIAKIIENVDKKLKQVVIELKLLEINRSSMKQLGIQLDNHRINVADIGRIPSSYQLPAALDFLESQNKARVLASPKIRVVHGKQASINIGEVIPVPFFRHETATSTVFGHTPQTFKEYRDVRVGIRLQVKPKISRDNEISLELNSTVDSVLDINQDGQIHRSERTTTTYVRIKDGETVVLGGLINQQDSDTRESPSLINRIPLVRRLISHTKADTRDSEMIMLVTPRLVNLDDDDSEFESPDSLFLGSRK